MHILLRHRINADLHQLPGKVLRHQPRSADAHQHDALGVFQQVQRRVQLLFAVDIERGANRGELLGQQLLAHGFQRVVAENMVMYGNGVAIRQRLAQRQLERRKALIAQLLREFHHARLANARLFSQLLRAEMARPIRL